MSISTSIKPKTKSNIKMTWEHVSPARAELWHKSTREACDDSSDFQQRNVIKAAVDRYAHDMKAGLWFSDTGQPILLSVHAGREVAVDGQQRINAIRKSGVGQDMWVARNVPVEAFKFVDQGAVRDLKAVMTAADIPSPNILSVVVTNLFNFETTGNPLTRPAADADTSSGNKLDWALAEHAAMFEFWEKHQKALRAAKRSKAGPESMFLYLFYQASQVDKALWLKWMDYMTDPDSNAAPNKALAIAYGYVKGIRAASTKKQGEYVNLTHQCMSAYHVAWQSARPGGKKIMTESGLKKAMNEYGIPAIA